MADRRSYDAWGKRRNTNGTPLANAFVTPEIRHGFTGHEELNDVGLIHMNGRLYDPVTGRFLSADPLIQFPDDLQSYNRYSYLSNNPLCGIDPSGHGLFSFIKKIFRAVGKVVSAVVRGVGHVISAALKNTVIRTIISVAAAYYLGIYDGGIFSGNAIANGAAAGFASGLISGRGDLKAALAGAFTGAAFGFVGDLAEAGSWNIYQKAFAHGIAGGVSSELSGGDFQSGFLSAGFAEYAGSWIPPKVTNMGQLAARVVVGGVTSELAGGKFENGAMTSAFAYLFNCMQHPAGCSGKIVKNPQADSLGASEYITVDALQDQMGLESVRPEYLIPLVKAGQVIGWISRNGEAAYYAYEAINSIASGLADPTRPPTTSELGGNHQSHQEQQVEQYKKAPPRTPKILRLR